MKAKLPRSLALLAALLVLVGPAPRAAAGDAAAKEDAQACQKVGAWLDPETKETVPAARLMTSIAKRNIVLLGETHTNVEHHRWQLHTLAGLHGHRSELVVGFEMFPRSVQPSLDAWSAGQSDEAEFLKASRWREVWGYGAELYLPLFHFVRQNRLRMIALNVDRELVSRVGREGWASIPESAKQGVSDPAPASDAYRRSLAEVYRRMHRRGVDDPLQPGTDEPPSEQAIDETPDLSETLDSDDFAKFVEAQLTWDRAMAEALAKARADNPDALVVGILGRGHIEHGYGVPHQLADLGEESVAVLLPVAVGAPCEALDRQVADTVFLVADEDRKDTKPAKPRLGIMIEQADAGVHIRKVVAGSVAEATGLATGDIILTAATFPIARVSELIDIVQRQAPGTWLPLEVKRDGETHQFVAKFPSRFE